MLCRAVQAQSAWRGMPVGACLQLPVEQDCAVGCSTDVQWSIICLVKFSRIEGTQSAHVQVCPAEHAWCLQVDIFYVCLKLRIQ
jgi:hypothetical protein